MLIQRREGIKGSNLQPIHAAVQQGPGQLKARCQSDLEAEISCLCFQSCELRGRAITARSDGSGSWIDKRSRVVLPVGLHSGVSQQLTIGFDIGISSGEQQVSIEN